MSTNDRRRAASRTGALSRVLEEVSRVPSAETPSDPVPTSSAVPRERTVYYPTKGHARVPARACRPWHLSDRPDSEFDHLDSLKQSIKADGQIQPIVVRPLAEPDPAGVLHYEVIAGRVRWRSAMEQDSDVDVVVRPLDDKQAFRLMCAENTQRRGISEYAKALSYARALEGGLYRNATELAEQLAMSKSTMSQYLAFAGLDSAVVQKLARPHEVGLRLGYALATAAGQGYLANILRDLPKIESGEISRDEIPAIWGETASSAPTRAAPVSRRPQHDHTFRAAGRVVFAAKVSAAGSAVIRFPTRAGVQFRETFWHELESLVKKHMPTPTEPD